MKVFPMNIRCYVILLVFLSCITALCPTHFTSNRTISVFNYKNENQECSYTLVCGQQEVVTITSLSGQLGCERQGSVLCDKLIIEEEEFYQFSFGDWKGSASYRKSQINVLLKQTLRSYVNRDGFRLVYRCDEFAAVEKSLPYGIPHRGCDFNKTIQQILVSETRLNGSWETDLDGVSKNMKFTDRVMVGERGAPSGVNFRAGHCGREIICPSVAPRIKLILHFSLQTEFDIYHDDGQADVVPKGNGQQELTFEGPRAAVHVIGAVGYTLPSDGMTLQYQCLPPLKPEVDVMRFMGCPKSRLLNVTKGELLSDTDGHGSNPYSPYKSIYDKYQETGKSLIFCQWNLVCPTPSHRVVIDSLLGKLAVRTGFTYSPVQKLIIAGYDYHGRFSKFETNPVYSIHASDVQLSVDVVSVKFSADHEWNLEDPQGFTLSWHCEAPRELYPPLRPPNASSLTPLVSRGCKDPHQVILMARSRTGIIYTDLDGSGPTVLYRSTRQYCLWRIQCPDASQKVVLKDFYQFAGDNVTVKLPSDQSERTVVNVSPSQLAIELHDIIFAESMLDVKLGGSRQSWGIQSGKGMTLKYECLTVEEIWERKKLIVPVHTCSNTSVEVLATTTKDGIARGEIRSDIDGGGEVQYEDVRLRCVWALRCPKHPVSGKLQYIRITKIAGLLASKGSTPYDFLTVAGWRLSSLDGKLFEETNQFSFNSGSTSTTMTGLFRDPSVQVIFDVLTAYNRYPDSRTFRGFTLSFQCEPESANYEPVAIPERRCHSVEPVHLKALKGHIQSDFDGAGPNYVQSNRQCVWRITCPPKMHIFFDSLLSTAVSAELWESMRYPTKEFYFNITPGLTLKTRALESNDVTVILPKVRDLSAAGGLSLSYHCISRTLAESHFSRCSSGLKVLVSYPVRPGATMGWLYGDLDGEGPAPYDGRPENWPSGIDYHRTCRMSITCPNGSFVYIEKLYGKLNPQRSHIIPFSYLEPLVINGVELDEKLAPLSQLLPYKTSKQSIDIIANVTQPRHTTPSAFVRSGWRLLYSCWVNATHRAREPHTTYCSDDMYCGGNGKATWVLTSQSSPPVSANESQENAETNSSSGTCVCTCNERWMGARCDVCRPPYSEYPVACEQIPLPEESTETIFLVESTLTARITIEQKTTASLSNASLSLTPVIMKPPPSASLSKMFSRSLVQQQTISSSISSVALPPLANSSIASSISISLTSHLDESPLNTTVIPLLSTKAPGENNATNATSLTLSTAASVQSAEEIRMVSVVGVASPVAVTSAAIVGGFAAAGDLQMLGVASFLSCAPANVKASADTARSSTSPLKIGSGPDRYLKGILALSVAFPLVQLVGLFLSCFIVKLPSTLTEAPLLERLIWRSHLVRFPSFSLKALALCSQGLALEAMLAFKSGNSNTLLAVLAAMVTVASIISSIWFFSTRFSTIVEIPYSPEAIQTAPEKMQSIVPRYYFSPTEERHRWGFYFNRWRRDHACKMTMLMLLRPVLTAVIAAFDAASPAACNAQFGIISTLPIVLGVVVVFMAPMRTVGLQPLAALCHFLTGFTFFSPVFAPKLTVQLILATSGVGFCSVLASAMFTALEVFKMKKQERKVLLLAESSNNQQHGNDDSDEIDVEEGVTTAPAAVGALQVPLLLMEKDSGPSAEATVAHQRRRVNPLQL